VYLVFLFVFDCASVGLNLPKIDEFYLYKGWTITASYIQNKLF